MLVVMVVEAGYMRHGSLLLTDRPATGYVTVPSAADVLDLSSPADP